MDTGSFWKDVLNPDGIATGAQIGFLLALIYGILEFFKGVKFFATIVNLSVAWLGIFLSMLFSAFVMTHF